MTSTRGGGQKSPPEVRRESAVATWGIVHALGPTLYKILMKSTMGCEKMGLSDSMRLPGNIRLLQKARGFRGQGGLSSISGRIRALYQADSGQISRTLSSGVGLGLFRARMLANIGSPLERGGGRQTISPKPEGQVARNDGRIRPLDSDEHRELGSCRRKKRQPNVSRPSEHMYNNC